MNADSLTTRLHLAIDALERSGRTAPLRAVEALLRGYESEDQDVEPETVRAVDEEWRDIPELQLPEDIGQRDDWAGSFYREALEEVREESRPHLPAIGTRVRIPVVFPRIGRVMAHRDGGADVELPGDSKLLWVAAGDLEAEG